MEAAPLVKVQSLINLALDLGTTPEESRTAAYTAVRLIQKHSLIPGLLPPPTPAPNPTQHTQTATPNRCNGAAMAYFAESKVARLITYLQTKSFVGEYPRYTVKRLVALAVKHGEIHPEDHRSYQFHLRRALQRKVREGILISMTSHKGGYQLA